MLCIPSSFPCAFAIFTPSVYGSPYKVGSQHKVIQYKIRKALAYNHFNPEEGRENGEGA
jgi:hypothetical protein